MTEMIKSIPFHQHRLLKTSMYQCIKFRPNKSAARIVSRAGCLREKVVAALLEAWQRLESYKDKNCEEKIS